MEKNNVKLLEQNSSFPGLEQATLHTFILGPPSSLRKCCFPADRAPWATAHTSHVYTGKLGPYREGS